MSGLLLGLEGIPQAGGNHSQIVWALLVCLTIALGPTLEATQAAVLAGIWMVLSSMMGSKFVAAQKERPTMEKLPELGY